MVLAKQLRAVVAVQAPTQWAASREAECALHTGTVVQGGPHPRVALQGAEVVHLVVGGQGQA